MLSRRRFFRGVALGVGGVYLASFLNQLEAAESGQRPIRFLFFLQGNGIYPNEIQPVGLERPDRPTGLEDRDLTEFALADSMQPLEPFKHQLALIHGLSGRVCGPPSHSADFGALGCYPQRLGAAGETIDAALAKRLPGIFPHVGLGVQSKPDRSTIYNVSAWERGKRLPTQCQPLLAHRRLFSSAASGEAQRAFDAQTNVLDFLSDDVRRIQGTLSASERERLDPYLDALERMSDRQSALVRTADRIRAAAPEVDRRFGTDTMVFERLEAQFEIASGALIAGLTNVVTVSSGSGLQFSGLDVDGSELGFGDGPINGHSIGHGGSYFGKAFDELHAAIRRRHLELLAGCLNRLAAVPEGDGTMLDNTFVLYTSDHGEGHHPRCWEWPMVLIGNLGGKLQTGGRYLRFPWYGEAGHRTVANLYSTLLHAVGDSRPRFGMADIGLRGLNQDGPLDELLV